MRSARPLPLLPPLFALLCAAGSTRAAPAAQTPPLTVAQIVARAPSLAGTAPAAPSWSPDGRALAFSWNDRAMPAREISASASISTRSSDPIRFASTSVLAGRMAENRRPCARATG